MKYKRSKPEIIIPKHKICPIVIQPKIREKL